MENKKETNAKIVADNSFAKELKSKKRRKPRQMPAKSLVVKAEKKEEFQFKKEKGG